MTQNADKPAPVLAPVMALDEALKAELEAARAALHLPQPASEQRIVVAMSGGVDSSVTALLLKYWGYDVVGITLQLYDHGAALQKTGACCAGIDIRDARQVAQKIDIPHYVLDYEGRFLDEVIERFADSYLRGETPVPCVLCNEEIKFNHMLKAARELGAVAMATGHYVRSQPGAHGEGWELHCGTDESRDQSYFLFSTPREQLDYLRFPLGGLSKISTRRLARAFGLEVANKADSQDICFVPEGKYGDVIEKLRPGCVKAGDIVHVDGQVLGRHEGIIHYTIGQRRGLGVAVGEPLFVLSLDALRNEVIVGPREHLLVHRVNLHKINWLGDGALQDIAKEGLGVQVRVRSTRPPAPARLFFAAGKSHIILAKGEYGVSAGQACVFYEHREQEEGGDFVAGRVLGGGWISSAQPKK